MNQKNKNDNKSRYRSKNGYRILINRYHCGTVNYLIEQNLRDQQISSKNFYFYDLKERLKCENSDGQKSGKSENNRRIV